MKSKKKLIAMVSSLALVVVAAVVAIVAVLAATSQTVTSGITVRYTATNVAATVSANYYLGSDNAVAMVDLAHNNATTLTFEATTSGGGSLVVPDADENGTSDTINLTDAKNYVIFEHIISNTSINVPFTAAVTFTPTTNSNMTVEYAYGGTTRAATTAAREALTWGNSFTTQNVAVASNETTPTTVYVYTRVSITNQANNASLEGTINVALTAVNS